MIWATVTSKSCFCWLYSVSPSLAAKNIVSLILVLCHWEKVLLWPVCSLDKTLWAFALLHFVLQAQSYLLFWGSLDSLHLHSNPLWWKGWGFFLVLFLEGVIGLHRTSQLQLLQYQWLRYRFGLLWCWIVCLGNKLRSFYHFWDAHTAFWTLVDYEGYSISSKGFLPTVVYVMVIWIKFTHSHPF